MIPEWAEKALSKPSKYSESEIAEFKLHFKVALPEQAKKRETIILKGSKNGRRK